MRGTTKLCDRMKERLTQDEVEGDWVVSAEKPTNSKSTNTALYAKMDGRRFDGLYRS